MIARRYLAKHCIRGTLLVLAVLMALDSMFSVASELGDTGEGNYAWPQALLYVVLGLPGKAYVLFPFATLIGTGLAIGLLSGESELTVLRVSGWARGSIALAALLGIATLTVCMLLLGEGISARAQQYAEQMKINARGSGLSVGYAFGSRSKSGLWLKQGAQVLRVVNVLPGENDNEVWLKDISVYQFDYQEDQVSLVRADEGIARSGVWQLFNGAHQQRSGIWDYRRFDEYEVAVDVPLELLQAAVLSPNQLTLPLLERYAAFLTDNGLNARPFRHAYWRRVIYPVHVMGMALLGLLFTFSRVRESFGLRLMLGIAAGMSFYLGQRFVVGLGDVYQWSIMWSHLALPISVTLASLGLLSRQR